MIIIIGMTAVALPGCLVLIGWGAVRVRRGRRQKSRKDLVQGLWALGVGFFVLTPGTYLLVKLYNSGATLGTGWN